MTAFFCLQNAFKPLFWNVFDLRINSFEFEIQRRLTWLHIESWFIFITIGKCMATCNINIYFHDMSWVSCIMSCQYRTVTVISPWNTCTCMTTASWTVKLFPFQQCRTCNLLSSGSSYICGVGKDTLHISDICLCRNDYQALMLGFINRKAISSAKWHWVLCRCPTYLPYCEAVFTGHSVWSFGKQDHSLLFCDFCPLNTGRNTRFWVFGSGISSWRKLLSVANMPWTLL